MKTSVKFALAAGAAASAAGGLSTAVLQAQSARMRRAFEADARQPSADVSCILGPAGPPCPLTDAALPAVAIIGDSWLAGLGLSSSADHPALRIARGFAALTASPVRLRSTAAPAVGAAGIAAQVSHVLSDARMRPDSQAPRLAVLSMGTADIVHPVSGTIDLPILTNAINRLQKEGGYRVIVLTTPNLGGLPGVRNPMRTILRRSSRVLAGSQTIAALSANAVPLSLTELLSGTTVMSLLNAEGRYPSAFGYGQIAAAVIATAARIFDFPTAITESSEPSATPPAPTEPLARAAAAAPAAERSSHEGDRA